MINHNLVILVNILDYTVTMQYLKNLPYINHLLIPFIYKSQVVKKGMALFKRQGEKL